MIDDPKADLMHGKPYPFLKEGFRVRSLAPGAGNPAQEHPDAGGGPPHH